MTAGKTIPLTSQNFVGKIMSLLLNMLSRLVITFLPRSKCLLISWLQSPPAVILELLKIKSVTVSIVSPSICHEVMGPDAMIFIFWMLSFKPAFSLSSFTFIRRLLRPWFLNIRLERHGAGFGSRSWSPLRKWRALVVVLEGEAREGCLSWKQEIWKHGESFLKCGLEDSS